MDSAANKLPSSLASLVEDQAMPESSAHWLINSVNPFPDYAQRAVGIPCRGLSDSVVKTVQKTLRLTKPNFPDLPPSTLWDVLILTMPFDSAGTLVLPADTVLFGQVTFQYDLVNNNVSRGIDNSRLGVIMCFACPAGANPIPWSNSFAINATYVSSISLGDAWAEAGACRIVALGFEVDNVTPALYRGGNVFTFRQEMSEPTDTYAAIEGLDGATFEAVMVKSWANVPADPDEVYRIPGSHQWNAELGCYVVATFNTAKDRLERGNSGKVGYCISEKSPPTRTVANTLKCGYDPPLHSEAVYETHLDMSGAYFTGLAPESVLIVTLKSTIEIIPDVGDDLIDFLQPTTPFDPKVDMAYELMKAALPPGVPKRDNDAGDFFKGLIDVLEPALSFVFPEFSPLIVGAGELGKSFIDKGKSLKKQKKPIHRDISEVTDKFKRLGTTMSNSRTGTDQRKSNDKANAKVGMRTPSSERRRSSSRSRSLNGRKRSVSRARSARRAGR